MNPPLRTVLVVNDDLFFNGRILSVLERAGFRALSAPTLAAAEQLLRESPPDIVIVNLASQKLGGVEAVRALRSAGAARILAFLSHTQIPAVRDEVLSAGADRLIPNSAVTMRLPEVLEQILSEAGSR